MWISPLRPLPGALLRRCSLPFGGQSLLANDETPQYSFVIHTGANTQTESQALSELFRTLDEVESAELILVSSTARLGREENILQVARRLQNLFGVRVHTLAYQGAPSFTAASNLGMMAATGQFIVLINKSTFFSRGWLSTLHHTFQQQPSAGIVGPLLLNTEGLVNEAGGLVFSNGKVATYGHLQPATHHSFKYLREVDFVSGACMAVRKSLLYSIGGFDTQFTLSQYAAADLGMAAREAGYKVLLQPLAIAQREDQMEGAADPATHQATEAQNMIRLKAKWRQRLQEEHCTPGSSPDRQAAVRLQSPRVLWVDSNVPEPDRDSGSLRTLSILRILLSEGYHVTYLPVHDISSKLHVYATRARFLGVDVVTPITTPDSWSLLDKGGRCKYDVIVAARWGIYADTIGYFKRDCPQVPLIFDTVDLHFVREARLAMAARNAQALTNAPAVGTGYNQQHQSWNMDSLSTSSVLEYLRPGGAASELLHRQFEAELLLVSLSNMTLVVSDAEVQLLHSFHPDAQVAVVSNVHEAPPHERLAAGSCTQRSGLLFVGSMSHEPNRQAVEEMVVRVLPALLERLPPRIAQGVVLHVVGSGSLSGELQQLLARSEHIKYHGYLPDHLLSLLYASVKVAVAPLLVGSGVKGKVNQAMNNGVPVVATPVAVEGMNLQDGRDCLLASSPVEFAARVAEAYMDCALWSRLVQGGQRNIRQRFSVEVAHEATVKAFKAVGVGPLSGSQRGYCQSPQLAH